MTVQRQIDQLITQRASEWVDILKTGGERERAAFVDWLRESRRHVAEYLAVVALDRELDGLDLKTRFDVQGLLQKLSPAVPDLSARRASDRGGLPQRLSRWPLALAAGLTLLAVAGWMAHSVLMRHDFKTSVGEQRSITLADGSIVQLNADSELRVHFDGAGRDLELSHGEALFSVTRDTHRPFRVHTRDAVVQAIGTQFNVYARRGNTTVSVLEGKVQILRGAGGAALSAGQQASIERTGRIERAAHPNMTAATAWRQRRLVFQQTALGEVVEEFNRYNVSPRLKLENVDPVSRHYSATFDANDPKSFTDFLVQERDLAVDNRGDEILIRSR